VAATVEGARVAARAKAVARDAGVRVAVAKEVAEARVAREAAATVGGEEEMARLLPSVWQEAPDGEPTAAPAPAPASEAVDDEDDDQVMLPSAWQDSTASDGACGVDCA
jgi:hypothetical protein